MNISFYARITLNTAEYCENLGYSMIFFFIVVVVVVTTPHTDANSIQKDNHQLSTQFKKTKRGPAFRAI